jgi:hypothetical protein
MKLKDRIIEHFNNKDWDSKFDWGKEKWGSKYETINSLAKIFNCPTTSLYIPIKELHKEGFLKYDYKLISTESKLYYLLNKEQNPEECDARNDAQSDTAG